MHSKNIDITRLMQITLLLFFIGHYSNTTMFYHTHEIDGRAYSHSHFFGLKNNKGIPVTSHTHTNNQLQLIDTFNVINLTNELNLIEVPAPNVRFIILNHIGLSQKIQLVSLLNLRLRAPPAC